MREARQGWTEQDDQQVQEEQYMRVSETYKSQSDWLKAEDLRGKTVPVTIDFVELADVGDEEKMVVHFVGKDKSLVLNKTNANTLAQAFGDETDDWPGKEIQMFAKKLTSGKFQGQSTIVVITPPPPMADEDDPAGIPF